jgi:hypothetical protein
LLALLSKTSAAPAQVLPRIKNGNIDQSAEHLLEETFEITSSMNDSENEELAVPISVKDQVLGKTPDRCAANVFQFVLSLESTETTREWIPEDP